MKWQALLSIVLAIILFTACEQSIENMAEPKLDRFESRDCQPVPDAPHVFNPSKIQVGTQFMTLEVIRLAARCVRLGDRAAYVGRASFLGEVILVGVFDRGAEGEPNQVCFAVAPIHDQRLPRMLGDQRMPRLCFDNPEQVSQMLNAERGVVATIVIDHFSIVHEPETSANRATLVRVIDTLPVGAGTDVIQFGEQQ